MMLSELHSVGLRGQTRNSRILLLIVAVSLVCMNCHFVMGDSPPVYPTARQGNFRELDLAPIDTNAESNNESVWRIVGSEESHRKARSPNRSSDIAAEKNENSSVAAAALELEAQPASISETVSLNFNPIAPAAATSNIPASGSASIPSFVQSPVPSQEVQYVLVQPYDQGLDDVQHDVACQSDIGSECCDPCAGYAGCCPNICGCDPCSCRLWFRAELLLMWVKGYELPPLLAGSPAGTPADQVGVLGQPGTNVLFGDDTVGGNLRIGGRLSSGVWLDDCRRFGIQGDFLWLGGDDSGYRHPLTSNGPTARPFFNTDTGVQDSQLLGVDGLANGSVDFNLSSSVYSFGPALRWNLCCCCGDDPCGCGQTQQRTDAILGYRYFRFDESLHSREVLLPSGPFSVPGTEYILEDRIDVKNEFHGIELGLHRIWQNSRWFYDVQAKCGIGEVTRRVTLDGSSRRFVPRLVDSTVPGGFLVRPQDIGTFKDRTIAFLPQLQANIGICLGNNWRAFAGYNFTYLSSVYRPGDFVSTTFDGSTLAAGGIPSSTSTITKPSRHGMYLHGVTLGVSYNF